VAAFSWVSRARGDDAAPRVPENRGNHRRGNDAALEATGNADQKGEKLTAINAALDKFGVREAFRRAAEIDGWFGRAQIYIDVGTSENDEEQITPLILDPAKITKGSLKRLTVIEPIWTSAGPYNSTNPMAPDFYRPQSWFVMGKQVHRTRLLNFVSREVPDLLKPSYNFGGLSLTQMAQPYVDNWIRTRQSVSDLLHSFTVFVLKTNMSAVLSNDQNSAGTDQFFARMDMFNRFRDNRGLMAVDKESEELDNVSVPLGTLDHLQAQAQEQTASVASIPLVKLLGITPSGLNASSDGEIRVFYDTIHARQERLFEKPLQIVLKVLQLHLFGEIDAEIGFRFEPLWQLDDQGKATVEKTKA
jgi:phage-related protein (TIGR01555 family)